jgi:hypothetical protein
MPAAANAFAVATARCNADPSLICPKNFGKQPRPLKMALMPHLINDQRLARIRQLSGNPNITWDTLVPPGAKVAMEKRAS